MAQYNRYVYVPHESYDIWRMSTLGNGYNVDYKSYMHGYGNQCWDYCALLYFQYGLTLVTKAGGGTAYDCWRVSRQVNSRFPFISDDRVNQIKRGDIIVTKSPQSKTGHICFADENYRASGDKTKLWCIGQNQRGNSALPVTRDEVNIRYFVGLFRNTQWIGATPPTPEPSPESVYNRSRYNFVLFNRRKRQDQWTRKLLKTK